MEISNDEIISSLDSVSEFVKYPSEIFSYLRGGKFLCASTPSVKEALWYEDLKAKFPVYHRLFQIAFGEEIIQRNGYYFFAVMDNANRDLKVKSIGDAIRDYNFCVQILRLVLQEIEPGDDKLRSSSVQKVIQGEVFNDCKKRFTYKDKSVEETRHYTDEIFNLLENQLGIVRRSDRSDGSVYIIQESYNYYKELLEQLPEHTNHDDESDFLNELASSEMADMFSSDSKQEIKEN